MPDRQPVPPTPRVIRVFVLSTFRDMQEERDVLLRLNRFDEASKAIIDAALRLDPADADFVNTRQAICQAMAGDPVPQMSVDELTIAHFDALAAFDGAGALGLVEGGANVNARDMRENTPPRVR